MKKKKNSHHPPPETGGKKGKSQTQKKEARPRDEVSWLVEMFHTIRRKKVFRLVGFTGDRLYSR